MQWWSTLMKWLYALGVVVASFSITMWAMNFFSPLCPQGDVTVLTKPFEKAGAVSWFATAPSLAEISDTSSAPARSNAVVCEDDLVMGPAHSVHADIAAKGSGRFSHWNTGFVFSASDNSDPNKNGRNYSAVRPR
jgi:hypothetical protein